MREVQIVITHRDITETILSCGRDLDLVMEELRRRYEMINGEDLETFRAHVRKTVLPNFTKKWESTGCSKSKFMSKFDDWLKKYLIVNIDVQETAGYTAIHRNRKQSSDADAR